MDEKNLSLYGTPWHPKWFTKFRYFPCSHCLFVNLTLIDLNLLDFRPIKIVWDKEYSKLNTFNNKWSLFARILKKYLVLIKKLKILLVLCF